MRQYILVSPIVAASLLISMCGGGDRAVVEPVPGSTANLLPSKLAGPLAPMAVPTPEEAWIPVSVGAEKGANLAAALKARAKIAVVVPKAHDVRDLENRIHQMVRASAPDTAIVARSEAVLDKFLEDKTEIPYRPSTADNGAPTHLQKEEPTVALWRAKSGPLKEVDAVLIVRSVKIDDLRASEMRMSRTGGCDAEMTALQNGLNASTGYFASYESQAAEVLGKEFSRQLLTALPLWRAELKQAADIAVSGSPSERCLAAYRAFLDKYDPCLKGACPLAPRVFPSSGGIVGMVDESALISDVCPTPGMRDFAAEIRDLGDRTLAEMMPTLSGDWTGEMLRRGALERIYAGLSDACAPRIRRLRMDDLQAVQIALHDYLVRLNSGDFAASWERMRGLERIVGVGPVRVLARVKAQVADPSVEAAAVLQRVRGLDQCAQSNGRLLQVSLVDTKSLEVLFMDIFFEAYLLCADLPPR